MNGNIWATILPLVILIAVMYFLLIRPQKKREKEVNAMRSGVQVGDEIITIGGICGKVVKTKEESLVIQVGADRVKFEIMRWAVSKVVEETEKPAAKAHEEEAEETEVKKSSKPTTMRLLPRRNIPHPTNLSSLARRLSLMPKIVMPPVRVRFLNTAKPKRSMPRACPNRLRPSMTSFSAPKSWTSITAHQ